MCGKVLSANDPEPGVGSVVLDRTGTAWQLDPGLGGWTCFGWEGLQTWGVVQSFGPAVLIYRGGTA